MTNQSLLDKAKEQHQARSVRVCDAAMAVDNASSEIAIAAALAELAAIWREEATAWMTPDDKGQLRRGAKGAAESLRDCATRIMGFVEGLKKHGLPESLEVSGPKGSPAQDAATSTESPAQANGAAQAGISGYVVDERGSFVTPEEFASLSLAIPQDLRAVHDGQMTADQFRAKHGPAKVPTDQMVEFLKNRHDADPKAPISQSATPAPTVPKMTDGTIGAVPTGPALGANGAGTPTLPTAIPHPSDDPAGDFLRDLGRKPMMGDWTKLDEIARQGMGHDVLIVNDPNPTRVTSALDDARNYLQEQTLEQAGAAILEQVQTQREKALTKTDPWTGEERPLVLVPLNPGDPSTWTVSAAPPPPAWTLLPEVQVKSLSDDPSAWELPSPDHTSPSQANLAGKCGLRWWLRYRRGAQERPGWSAVGGTAVHSCIEAIEQSERIDDASTPASVITGGIRQLWTEQFGRAIAATQKENPDYPIETWSAAKSGKEDRTWWDLDGPEMVHRYLAWRATWIAQGWEIARTKDGRPAVEVECLSTIRGVPKPVKQIIDQVWFHRASGQLAIVDLKSGATAQPDFFQIAANALALTSALANEYVPYVGTAPKGAFWDARSGQLGPLVRLIERHPDEEVAMRLAAPARMDAAGLYIANVEGGYGGCNGCPLKRACPVGSRAGKGES